MRNKLSETIEHQWMDTRLGGFALLSISFIFGFIFLILSWQQFNNNSLQYLIAKIGLFITGSFLVIIGLVVLFITVRLWHYRSTRFKTSEEKISLLQEKMMKMFRFEKVKPRSYGIVKCTEEWVISKDSPSIQIHILIYSKKTRAGQDLFLRIGPVNEINKQFSKDLEEMICQIL